MGNILSFAKIKRIANWIHICSGILFIKMTNNKCPKTLPWGTPDKTLHRSKSESSTLILQWL